MLKFKIYYWPIFTSLWFYVTFITSYIIAVAIDHVYPVFPFISDTGTVVPESCIFGQMLNLGALFMAITLYIRHRNVELCDCKSNPFLKRWNRWGNVFGILACLGMSIVANFQETSVGVMHFIGAFLAFGIGGIYFIIQTYISWFSDASQLLKYIRIILGTLIIPAYIVSMVCSSIAFQQFDGSDIIKWDSSNKGYDLRLTGAFSEWILAILMTFYVISFTSDFRKIKYEEIQFVETKYL